MRLPEKLGLMYVMYDDEHKLEYGFEVSINKREKKIVKFFNFGRKKIDKIVLPKIINNFPAEMLNNKIDKENYLKGALKICKGCFEGVNNVKIIIPFNNSVNFEVGCFDDKNVQVEILAPKNMGLQQVSRKTNNLYDNNEDSWVIVGDKRLIGNNFSVLDGGVFSVEDYYYDAYYDSPIAKITVSKSDDNNNSFQA